MYFHYIRKYVYLAIPVCLNDDSTSTLFVRAGISKLKTPAISRKWTFVSKTDDTEETIMKHEIKQKSTILIFALVLMAFVTHSIHRDNLAVAQFVFVAPVKNPQVFAQAAYDKFKRILTRDDLLPLLPDVLTALKDDKFANPNLSVEIFFTPPLLRQHIPNIDERFITLLDVPEIIEMFTDFEMTRLYGFPAAIDALLDLLAPHLKQVKIVSAFVNAGRYGTLIITGSGMQIGESVAVGTTHTLIFTIINAEGNPVPGLPLNYSINPLDGTAATATFNPATATTNQDGKVYAEITFGPNPGDLRLFAEVDSQRIVEFVELELTQGNTNVNNVTMKGLEHGFARTGTTQTLVFKATDANGRPVQGEELMFGARSEYSSAATATFDPATATTDQNGEARTQITFGAKPGGINLTVQSGPAVEQVNITSSQVHLGSQMEGAFTGLQVGDSVDVGSIHTLVFTATDLRGRPVSGLPIAFTFGGIPLELEAMFDPATATTDRRGQVRTQVTFGEEPGDFELIVSIDAQRVIVFSEPEFKLEATNIGNLKVQGMEKGFAEPGSSINLVLTATDARGRPVANEELVFGVGIAPDIGPTVVFEPVIAPNRATAVFKPAKVKTNQKGKAQTRVTFGPEPGRIRLTVKSGMIIHSIMLDLEPYGTLKLGGLQIGDAVRVNSTHKLVFTATNEMNKTVPGLPLRFDVMYLDGTEVGATFAPRQVVTNKNGKARTSVTFGDAHGDIRLIVAVDREQIVDLLTPKITLDDPKVAKLTVEGIEQGFARVGTTRKLFVTAKNKNGRPVSGVNLAFGFRSPPESEATVMFSEATVKTDKNGQAQTEVIVGENPGSIRFIVQPLDRVTIHSFSSDFNLSMLTGELTTESFTIGDTFKIDSTHNFVFTATSASGDPVPWLPLKFSAVYLDGTEADLMFEPATTKTNKNGMVRTRITFSSDPGDIRLIAEVDRQQIVEFLEPEITLDGSSIAQLTLKGIEQGFSRVGTQRTLVFTATDENGDPVSGVELAFGFRSESDSKATATFDPETVTTDQNGKAQTDVTFGPKPGSLRFTVKPIERVRVVEIEATRQDVELTVEGIDLNTPLPAGSTHNLVLTVKNTNGTLFHGATLTFSVDPVGNSQATVTFESEQATTNQDGEANVQVTLGPKTGDIGIYVSVVPSNQEVRVVEISTTGQDVQLTVTGLELNTPVPASSTHNLVFTLINANGQPLVDTEIIFTKFTRNFVGGNPATVIFDPPQVRTNQHGEAETRVTFGPNGGDVEINALIQSPSYFYWISGYNIQRANRDGSNYGRVLNAGNYVTELALDSERGQLYWVEQGSGANRINRIRRANLDGSNQQDIVTGFGNPPSGLALDVLGGKIYWSYISSATLIQRANIDGSNIEDVVTEKSDEVRDFVKLAVDPVRRKIYWVRRTSGQNRLLTEIQRANLDGSNLETIINPNIFAADGQGAHISKIALDVERGKVYWLEPKGNSQYGLRCANLDGGNRQDLSDIEITPYSRVLALDSANGKIYWNSGDALYSADLNGDNIESIVPYWERNGRSVRTTARTTGLALNTRIGPLSIEEPTMSHDVSIRDIRLTLTPSSTNEPDIDVKIEGSDLSNGFLPGSKHKLTFTFTRKSGEPLSGDALVNALQDIEYLPSLTTEPDGKGKPQLLLVVNPRSSTTATFNPFTIAPDENGKAETYLTFGQEGGVIDIDVLLPVVAFQRVLVTDIRREGVDLDQRVTYQWVQGSSTIPGGIQKYIFTAMDNTGEALSGYQLDLHVDPSSTTTATFNSSTIEIDENGNAEMEIINGPQGGKLTIIAKLRRPDLYLKDLGYTFSDDVDSDMEIKLYFTSPGSKPVYIGETLISAPKDGQEIQAGPDLREGFPKYSDAAQVRFNVEKNGKPVPGLELVLTATSDNPSVTFNPATIVTDSSGGAFTTITVGKDVRELSIHAKVSLRRSVWIRQADTNFSIAGKGLVREQYLLGSRHKMTITFKEDDTEIIEGIKFTLKAIPLNLEHGGSVSTPTATFDPATVVTDKNGQAETYVTFGDTPGYMNITTVDVYFPGPRVARFYIINPGFTIKGSIEMDITLDGKSGKLSSTSDFSYPLSSVETPTSKKLVVKVISALHGRSVPYVDIVFSSLGGATIVPDKFRTDKNGQAATYITFEAEPQKNVHVHLKVNMVHIKVNLIEDSDVIPMRYGKTYETDRGVNKIKDLKFHVGALASNSGVLPLDTGAHFQFYPVSDRGGDIHIRPGAVYTISTRQTADIQFIRSYATSNKDGLLMVKMYTGSEPGLAEINLTPLKQAQVKGSIRIIAEDNDSPLAPAHFAEDQDLTPFNISSQNEFELRQITNFKREETFAGVAYDGMRVEVYITTRGIRSTGVEIGAYVKLYEGRSANTNDFEDVNFSIFVLPWNIPWTRGPIGWSYTDDPTNPGNPLPGLTSLHVPNGIKLPPLIKVANILKSSRVPTGAELLGISHLFDQQTPDINGGDEVYVALDLEVTPHNFTPVFAAPSMDTLSPFSVSDVNVDGQVNVTDLILVSNALEQTNLGNLRVDVNSDGIFTIADLIQVAQHLGQSIGSDTPAALVVPEGLTYATVGEWIASARAVDDGSLVFQQGIANLELLLTLIVPEKTVLLHNYPNPFNPETWIPYHLTEPAEVMISIYAVDGRLVRTLALGHQAAGYYQNKSRAAHWDGRNNVGERVASGIYFYTITAGDFAATKKMLIMK